MLNWGKKFLAHIMTDLESQTALESDVANNNKMIELPSEEDKFKCTKCDYKITTSNLMALRFHSFSKHLICIECKLEFESKEETVEHMVSIHHINVQCEFCSYTCLDPNWLDYHLLKKHPKAAKYLDSTKSECGACGFDFKSKRQIGIYRHLLNTHHFCKKCNCQLKDKEDLIEHLEQIHKLKLKCKKCNYASLKGSGLTLHLQNSSCGSIYTRKSPRNNGKRVLETEEIDIQTKTEKKRKKSSAKNINLQNCSKKTKKSKTLKCGKCKQVFKDGIMLEQHVIFAYCKKLFECPFCPAKFFHEKLVKAHEKICSPIVDSECKKASKETAEPLKCNKCNFTTLHKQSLNYHKRNSVCKKPSEKSRRLKCKECNFATFNIRSLALHQKKCKSTNQKGMENEVNDWEDIPLTSLNKDSIPKTKSKSSLVKGLRSQNSGDHRENNKNKSSDQELCLKC